MRHVLAIAARCAAADRHRRAVPVEQQRSRSGQLGWDDLVHQLDVQFVLQGLYLGRLTSCDGRYRRLLAGREPGPEPQGQAHEFGIIYFDASSIGNTKVTVYRYNGQNADNLFDEPRPSARVEPEPDGHAGPSRRARARWARCSFSVPINASVINSLFTPPTYPDWTGIEFGNKIGVWFHSVKGLNTAYDANGGLTQFSYGGQGWLDLSNQMTVPARRALYACRCGRGSCGPPSSCGLRDCASITWTRTGPLHWRVLHVLPAIRKCFFRIASRESTASKRNVLRSSVQRD